MTIEGQTNLSIMIELTIPEHALVTIKNKMAKITQFQWLVKAFKFSGYHMLGSIKDNFTQEGMVEKWKAWTPKWRKIREKIGDTGKILTLTGKYIPGVRYNHSEKFIKKHKIQSGKKGTESTKRVYIYNRALYNSFQTMDSQNVMIKQNGKINTMMMIGTNLIYAAVHQFGRKKLNIPPRPFLGFKDNDVITIKRIFEVELAEVVNS